MTWDAALRATEILLALSVAQAAAEHVALRDARLVNMARLALAVLLLAGGVPLLACWGLLSLAVALLWHHDGPFNGGADRMGFLVLLCLTLAHSLPQPAAELALAYLGVQLALSYFVSGWVKLRNPDWRSGQALVDVFRYSAYPVSGRIRSWADCPRLLWAAGWAVILFELAFPLALLHPSVLWAALACGLAFHVANAILFGLNRFVLAWAAAYPAILWLQARLIA